MHSAMQQTSPPNNPVNENVDPAELAKFTALAHKWWDPNSEFRPLHEINPLRLNWIDQRVKLSGKRVVDIGCGGGILAESMALRGAQVLGIDLAEKSLKVAELHKLESGVKLEYRHIAAEDLAQEQAESFDVVTCLEMLEHVPDPAATVAAAARLCKPGGSLFFSTINRNPKSFLFAIIGAEYVLQLLPKGTHSYEKFIKPSELSRYCRQAGLDTREIIGLTYNPITKIYKLEADTNVNYMVACKKPG
jgi:2-polyprenyl-6-hydroxyphenyl methylase/3-demethylubiquinone-9 3-methyltransferase